MADQQKDFFADLKAEFKDIGSKVNKMFDEVVRGQNKANMYPVTADIYETPDSMVYVVDLPGVVKTDFSVQVRDNKLVVKGHRAHGYDSNANKHLSERQFGEFYREFIVPAGVDTNTTKAKFENGVLRISLPKEATEIEVSEVAVD